MKRFLLSLVALAFLWLPTAPAQATNCGTGSGTCFWIPGSGAANWSATTNWSNSDGGASCTCTPTTGDAILFTSNSGTNGSTINANISIATLDATGSSALTLTHNSSITLTVTGDTFKFGGSLTYSSISNNRIVNFTPTSGHTVALTSNGQLFGAITMNGTGATLQAQDALRVTGSSTTSIFTLTAGTFDSNNKAVEVTSINAAAGTTVGLGNAGWTFSGNSSAPWTSTSTTTVTGTSTLTFTGASTTARAISCAGATIPGAVQLNTASFPTSFTGSGGCTITGGLNISAPNTVRFLNATYTLGAASNWVGTASAPILLISSVAGTAATLAFTAGSTLSWVGFSDITCTGSPTSSSSLDFGHNTNCGITAPSAGGGGIIGG